MNKAIRYGISQSRIALFMTVFDWQLAGPPFIVVKTFNGIFRVAATQIHSLLHDSNNH